jgi:LysM repeat protein
MSHLLHFLLSRPSSLVRTSLLAASMLTLASCKSTSSTSSGDSLYASNHGATDGGYRPYNAASGGTVQSTVPQYDRAVPPPPPGYDMPSAAEYRSPPATKSSSGSSSTGSSTSVSTAQKSSGSTTKSSGSTASTKKKTTSTPAKKKTSSSTAYTVVKGDTLYGLALRKHTTVAKIKAASGISSDKLSIGQKLRIP